MPGSSTFSIEEIKVTGKGRKVVLVGPALPFQGATWGARNALITTWYPGNFDGSQQVMGPQEKPSSLEGIWHRTLMGKNPSFYTDESGEVTQITNPAFMRDALESIFRGGALLRVVWTQSRDSGRLFSIERLGRASDWDFPHDRIEDISWKITFDWISRGVTQQKGVATREANLEAAFTSLDITMNDLATKVELEKVKSKKSGIKIGTGSLTLGQLEALANAPNAALKSVTRSLQRNINKIRGVVDVAEKFRNAPYDVMNTVLAAVKNNVALANQYYDTWSATPAEAQSVKSNVSDITRATSYFGQANDQIQNVSRQSSAFQYDLMVQVSASNPSGAQNTDQRANANANAITAIHIAKPGDTPTKLSLKYFGNPDSGPNILLANRLPIDLISFKPGKILIIPALGSSLQSKGLAASQLAA